MLVNNFLILFYSFGFVCLWSSSSVCLVHGDEVNRCFHSILNLTRPSQNEWSTETRKSKWWDQLSASSTGWCSQPRDCREPWWWCFEEATSRPTPSRFYRGNININDSEGPLVLPSLPQGHTFMVTSILMQMLTARGLFSGLPSEDPHPHITKLRSVCKNCVGIPNIDMDIIRLRVFPLSLTREAATWFTKFPYNSIYPWDQLRYVFLERYL